MSDRRATQAATVAIPAVPKLADVHSGYARALKHYTQLEAESARLRELPKDPDILMQEFGPGDLPKLEGLRQARLAELDGDSRLQFRNGAISRARSEMERLRDEASAIVQARIAPAYAHRLEAVADAVRGLVEAMAAHNRFLDPMAADNCNLAMLTGNCLPHRLVYELQTWLRGYETKGR